MINGSDGKNLCAAATKRGRWLAILLLVALAAPMWAVQLHAGGPSALITFANFVPEQDQWAKEMDKYPGLQPELARLMQRLQNEVHFPPVRRQSRLLPMLPDSGVFYAAIPNYGEALHQALQILREERKQSPPLNDWLKQNETSLPKPGWEESLEKLYQLSQFLGDEIVVTGGIKGQEPSFGLIAEVKKPGLRAFLLQMDREMGTGPKSPLKVVNAQELALLNGHRAPVESHRFERRQACSDAIRPAAEPGISKRRRNTFWRRPGYHPQTGTAEQAQRSTDVAADRRWRSEISDLGAQRRCGTALESNRVELYRSTAWSGVMAGISGFVGQHEFLFAQSGGSTGSHAQAPSADL